MIYPRFLGIKPFENNKINYLLEKNDQINQISHLVISLIITSLVLMQK